MAHSNQIQLSGRSYSVSFEMNDSYLEKNGPSDGTGERSNMKRKEAPAAEVENEGLSENKRTRTLTADATEEERTRSLIFEDLHKRNYFVGPADAYGGDYSLYKGGGDPTQTHSIATVRVIEKGHKVCVCAVSLTFRKIRLTSFHPLSFPLSSDQREGVACLLSRAEPGGQVRGAGLQAPRRGDSSWRRRRGE